MSTDAEASGTSGAKAGIKDDVLHESLGGVKAAFIDRDGVINEERHYVHRIEDFVILPGVVEGLTLLRNAGYKLVIVTNQAGIARGYYDESTMHRLHDHLRVLLAGHGITLDAIEFCPHHPQGSVSAYAIACDCRKPEPGMLLQAASRLGIDLDQSVLIGDKDSDIEAGRRASVRQAILVTSGHAISAEARTRADHVFDDLLAAARFLTAPAL